MPIQGTIERQRSPHGRRASARLRLNLEVAGGAVAGEGTKVLIHNLSSTGLLMETEADLAPGNKVVVALPEAGDVAATVVWQSESLFGCRFDQPLGRAALGAAQLRNPLPRDLQPAERLAEPDPHELLPERLLRLREERSLSRAELAARTGMSAPSIWAWETGKTIPRRNSLRALAAAFGLSEPELIGDAEAQAANSSGETKSRAQRAWTHVATSSRQLQDLLDHERKEIADLFGVETDKVKIIVEF